MYMKSQLLRLVSVLLVSVAAISSEAQTTTITYTATQRIDRFDEYSYFTGATGVASHVFDAETGKGTVVYDGTVTEIGKYALQFNSSLTSITLPEGITDIRYQAFKGCSNLTTINLPSTLRHIENLVFDGCTGLQNGQLIVSDIAWWCGITFDSVYANPLYHAKRIYSQKDVEITELVIPAGVTGVGAYAFSRCEGITSVSLPGTIVSIGDNAFNSCSNLATVNIPVGLETINQAVFEHCTALQSITIPEGVSTIGSGAFSYSGLRSLTLPSTIRSMSQSFYRCDSLTSLTLTEGITTLGDSFYSCTSLESVHIPSSVSIMQSNDFSGCSNLTTVTIAEGVETINGFGNCGLLSSINIPNSATKVYGFRNCSSLTSINIPRNVREVSGFNGCTALQKVIIEDVAAWCGINFSSYANYNPQYYAHHLFMGEEEITRLVIPDGVTTVRRYAFNGITDITSVVIPASVTQIDGTAFRNCPNVADIYCYADPQNLSFDFSGFMDDKATLCHVTDVTAWQSKFPNANVTFVGDQTNISYTATESIEAFNTVANFTGVTAVLSHTYDNETGAGLVVYEGIATGIADDAFNECGNLTSVVVPAGVTSLGTRAFADCLGLTSITLPASLRSIGDNAFRGASSVTDVYCTADADSVTWLDCDNVQAFKPGKATICHVTDSLAWQAKFPDANVTFAGDIPVFSYTATNRISIFDDITKFAGATAVLSHVFDEATGRGTVVYDREVTNIAYYCFKEVAALTAISVPPTVKTIGSDAFSNCANLTDVQLPDNIESIGSFAFQNCSSLINVNLPASLTVIDYDLFIGCSALADITIPAGVTTIRSSAFKDCRSLTRIDIPATVNSIWTDAFAGCTGLTKVTTPDIASWLGITFSNGDANPLSQVHHLYIDDDTEVTELEIPSSVTRINQYAFYGCTGLTHVKIHSDLASIGTNAFSGCTGLTKVTTPDLATWWNVSFDSGDANPLSQAHHLYIGDDTEVTEIEVPTSVTRINRYVFYGCNGLNRITIHSNVVSVGDGAFYGCTGLTKVTTPDLSAWCAISFGDSDANPLSQAHHLYGSDGNEITEVILPQGVTRISPFAFYNATELTDVVFPYSLKRIENKAFYGCIGLQRIDSYPGPIGLGPNVFDEVPTATCELHVLPQHLPNYQTANVWKDFNPIIGDLPPVKGDINGDGFIDSSDVSAILEIVLSDSDITPALLEIGDFNGDGFIDSSDVSAILEYVLVGD